MKAFWMPAILAVMCALPAFAQQGSGTAQGNSAENAQLLDKIRDLEDRVIALEGQVRTLKSAQAQPAAPATAG